MKSACEYNFALNHNRIASVQYWARLCGGKKVFLSLLRKSNDKTNKQTPATPIIGTFMTDEARVSKFISFIFPLSLPSMPPKIIFVPFDFNQRINLYINFSNAKNGFRIIDFVQWTSSFIEKLKLNALSQLGWCFLKDGFTNFSWIVSVLILCIQKSLAFLTHSYLIILTM